MLQCDCEFLVVQYPVVCDLIADGTAVVVAVLVVFHFHMALALWSPQIRVMSLVGITMKAAFKESDARIKCANEILSGMRVIKYYAWEKSCLSKVSGGLLCHGRWGCVLQPVRVTAAPWRLTCGTL